MTIQQIFNTSAELDYPTVLPTLDLDFANSKTLDPRITFTRSSGGSYVGADGLIKYAGVNEPRFDHDPVTGESLGLLVEGQRTNVVRYSQDMTNAAWEKGNLTVTKETISGPAGAIEYDKITLGTFTNSAGQVRRPITLTPGAVCSNSVYVKQGTCRYINLIQQYNNSGGIGAYFDLQTGTFLTGGGLNASSTIIQAVGNGWYRVQMFVTDVGPGGSAAFILQPMTIPNPPVNTSGGREYNGNGEFIYAYGAQIEPGAFPTSYIPTTSATVTRNADVASITGTNFSSWYNFNNVFSTYCEYVSVSRNIGIVYFIGDGADRNRALQLYETTSSVFEFGLFPTIGFGTTKGTSVKTAFGRLNGNNTGAVNGAIVGTSDVRASVLPDRLSIGGNSFYSDRYLSSTIKRLTYWPKRLPNSQLQALTR